MEKIYRIKTCFLPLLFISMILLFVSLIQVAKAQSSILSAQFDGVETPTSTVASVTFNPLGFNLSSRLSASIAFLNSAESRTNFVVGSSFNLSKAANRMVSSISVGFAHSNTSVNENWAVAFSATAAVVPGIVWNTFFPYPKNVDLPPDLTSARWSGFRWFENVAPTTKVGAESIIILTKLSPVNSGDFTFQIKGTDTNLAVENAASLNTLNACVPPAASTKSPKWHNLIVL